MILLANQVEIWTVLRDASLVEDVQVNWTKQAASFSENLKSLRESYAKDRTFLIDQNRFTFKTDFEQPVEGLTKKLYDISVRTWQAHFEHSVASKNKDVLDVLSKIDAYADGVRNIRRITQELENWRGRPPETENDLSRFHSAAEEVKVAWTSLEGGNLPPNVLAFLKEAGSAGAPLDKLTDEVLSWLRAHRITPSFRIRAS